MSSPMPNDNVGAVNVIEMNPHIVIDQMYGYTGIFRDGSALVPHPVEKKAKFDERRQFSCMTNTFATIVDATWKPVFDRPVVRETTDDAFMQFLANVDNRGTPIGVFMRHVAREVRKHSTLFIVMDNFTAEEMPPTEQEATNARALPYVYTKKPQEVKEYTLDRFGNVISITFCNGCYKDEQGKEWPCYIEITPEYFQQYYIKQIDGKAVKTPVDDPKQNTLGIVPVIIARDEIPEVGELCASPRMYGTMRVCYVIYNKNSEMREIERRQEFSMPYFFGEPPQSGGTGNALVLSQDSKAPGFLEPNPNILTGLLESANALQENLYRMCEQTGVIGVKSASSGVALAFEFMARDSILSETAEICENVERQMADLFGRWVNRDIEYIVKYERSYTPADEVMQLKMVDEVLINAERMPSRILKDAYKVLARKINPAITDDEIEAMEMEIEILKQDKMQSTDSSADNGEDEQSQQDDAEDTVEGEAA